MVANDESKSPFLFRLSVFQTKDTMLATHSKPQSRYNWTHEENDWWSLPWRACTPGGDHPTFFSCYARYINSLSFAFTTSPPKPILTFTVTFRRVFRLDRGISAIKLARTSQNNTYYWTDHHPYYLVTACHTL